METENIERVKKDLEETRKLMIRMNPLSVMLKKSMGVNGFKGEAYDSLYTFATEDMKTYYPEFGQPKSFLSICASGDQIINAALSGAKVIDAFDSNRLCRRALGLKLAALKGLSKEEFLEYYETFSPYLFAKFAEGMDEEDLDYWGALYQIFGPNEIGICLLNFLFAFKKLDRSVSVSINPYLLGSGYIKAQEAVKNAQINFIDCDLYNLPPVLGNKKYDAINLSNVYEYLNFGDETGADKASQYYNFLMDEMYPRLNENGTMMATYTYAFNDEVNEFFKKQYEERKGKLTYPGALNLEEYYYYLMGLTTQNLSYSLLYDLLGSRGEIVKKVATNHIQYGQSIDMSHDTAVLIKK